MWYIVSISVYQHLFPFKDRKEPITCNVIHCIYLCFCWWTFLLLPPFAVGNKAAVSVSMWSMEATRAQVTAVMSRHRLPWLWKIKTKLSGCIQQLWSEMPKARCKHQVLWGMGRQATSPDSGESMGSNVKWAVEPQKTEKLWIWPSKRRETGKAACSVIPALWHSGEGKMVETCRGQWLWVRQRTCGQGDSIPVVVWWWTWDMWPLLQPRGWAPRLSHVVNWYLVNKMFPC